MGAVRVIGGLVLNSRITFPLTAIGSYYTPSLRCQPAILFLFVSNSSLYILSVPTIIVRNTMSFVFSH